jgi:predicted aspartyl protease
MSLTSIAMAVVATLSSPTSPRQAPHSATDDKASSASAFMALERWRIEEAESLATSVPPGPERDLLDGVIANRRGQVTRSIGLLARAMATYSRRPDRQTVVAAMTLSDDYRKLSRFAEELTIDRLLLGHYAGLLNPSQRTEMQERRDTASILQGTPPTTVSWSGPLRLAMTREVVGLWSVPVSRHGVAARWSLDTGANYSVVSESTAKRLGLSILDGATTTGSSTTRRVGVRYAVVPELTLGTATLHDLVVLVLADEALHATGPTFEYQIDGLLGYNAFAALGSVTFDRAGLFLAGPDGPPLAGSAPLFMNDLMPVISVTVSGQPLPMALDTGANSTTFYQPYAQLFAAEAASWAKGKGTFTGAGGAVTADTLRQPRVAIELAGQKAILSDVTVLTSSHDGNPEILFGNAGIDLVNSYASFTVDFRKMRVHAKQVCDVQLPDRGRTDSSHDPVLAPDVSHFVNGSERLAGLKSAQL